MSVELVPSDLQFSYSSKAVPGDNARLRGLDSHLFNGHEQYEVLSFINSFLGSHTRDGAQLTKADGLKVERMLQKKPGEIRSQVGVNEWVLANWKNFS